MKLMQTKTRNDAVDVPARKLGLCDFLRPRTGSQAPCMRSVLGDPELGVDL